MMRGSGGEDLRHVLDVREHCVFQTVTGVRPTAAFAGAQVLSEPGNKHLETLLMLINRYMTKSEERTAVVGGHP